MPVITRFYGILIKMYFREHDIPHFHAICGEYNGVFDVETLEMIEGDLPARAQKMIQEWASQYQSEPLIMWKTQKIKKLPGLKIGDKDEWIPKDQVGSSNEEQVFVGDVRQRCAQAL